jgi:hypothetical protein
MIRLNYKSDTYFIKNSLDELSINQFEFITTILNKMGDTEVSKWKTILNFLDLPFEVLDDMDEDDILKVVTNFKLEDLKINKYIKEIKLDKRKFLASKVITVKQISMVEDYLDKDSTRYIGELLAIIFREKDKSKEEHFNIATIEANAELFRYNVKMNVALPYINLLTANLITKYDLND